jgi:hypothetical protein
LRSLPEFKHYDIGIIAPPIEDDLPAVRRYIKVRYDVTPVQICELPLRSRVEIDPPEVPRAKARVPHENQ